MSDDKPLVTDAPPKRGAWLAWDADSPDEGVTVVWAFNKHGAVARGCDQFGYDLDYLAECDLTPGDAVVVVRAPEPDEFERPGLVPEEALAPAAHRAIDRIQMLQKPGATDPR